QLDGLIHSINPTLATYAKTDAVDVRISAKMATREEAEKQVVDMEVKVRAILDNSVFGIDNDTLASVVGDLLQTRNQTLGVMESLTGGLLSSALTDVKGSSSHFIGGLVTYSTDMKEWMGVPKETVDRYGVVSEQTAKAMAHAVRERLGTTFGIGITGVAGPGLQEDKPVGTVHIAVEGSEGVVMSMGPGWRGNRQDNKRYAVLTALNLLRQFLEGTVTPEKP
ncbi:MAG TPA: damage-inducible protein CinA, partial [Ktedonobacter sp.]|nr:damage-inducible protein CinA [Ktedonobacter sp.]